MTPGNLDGGWSVGRPSFGFHQAKLLDLLTVALAAWDGVLRGDPGCEIPKISTAR